jgi:hypothetical protein
VTNREQLRQEEANFIAFLAKASTHRRLGRDGPTSSSTDRRDSDKLVYAIWALRRALEDADWASDPPPPIDPQHDDETKARLAHLASIRVLDGYVPAAAQWIFHAGRAIFCSTTAATRAATFNSGGEDADEGEEGAADGGTLWQGGAGFTRDRWAFWKQRFAWVHTCQELDQSTRDVAHAAAATMERIEKEAEG